MWAHNSFAIGTSSDTSVFLLSLTLADAAIKLYAQKWSICGKTSWEDSEHFKPVASEMPEIQVAIAAYHKSSKNSILIAN